MKSYTPHLALHYLRTNFEYSIDLTVLIDWNGTAVFVKEMETKKRVQIVEMVSFILVWIHTFSFIDR
jgi:hypothetical protein